MSLRSILRNMLTVIAVAIAATAGSATLPGDADAPVPHQRPDTGENATAGDEAGAARVAGVPEAGPMEAPADISRLKEGLDALSSGSAIQARVIRESLPKGSLDRDILTWAIALDGGKDVPSGEIADASRELAGWPGMDALRRNAEEALFRENPPPAAVVKAFGGTPPRTPDGLILLARSWLALGERGAALAVLSPFWRKEKLDAKDETAILAEFGSIIPAADHRYRMERMLYEDRIASAGRVADLAGAKPLADAWSAVIRNSADAGKLLDAVPEAQRGAGYDFARIRWLRRSGKYEEAAAAMLKAPRDDASLIDPDEWWQERRALSRDLLDAGDAKTAYALAAAHSAETPAMAADAEFHAGWYALRGLGDATLAAGHFQRIAEIAGNPLSLSRAYYWLGRAAEKGGPGDADSYFRRAAEYGATFNGQLAAERLGRKTIDIPSPEPSANDRALFGGREAVRAIGRLDEAGYAGRAGILFQDLAQELASPGELVLLAGLAEQQGNDFMALRVGKIAARRGIDIGALAHPIGAIPASAKIDTAGKALAYAVARQESEFNVAAISGSGALGLLQLMPGTAREMAKKTGLPYSEARLTTDAGYNATLGAAFLADQLARFDGSYILTFIGYNAGPRRAREWIARYGDPRGGRLDDVVDWIEHIPYAETRNYVQRVMENYEIYKMRLSGRFDIAGDLVKGK
jgi:soluble lytic murein transglycosylase